MKKYRVHIPIYDFYLDLYVSDDIPTLNKINNTILKKAGFDEEDDFDAQARFFPAYADKNKRVASMVFNKDLINYELISHEIYHFVIYISKISDFQLNDGSEECFSYLTGFISQQVFDKLKIYLK